MHIGVYMFLNEMYIVPKTLSAVVCKHVCMLHA